MKSNLEMMNRTVFQFKPATSEFFNSYYESKVKNYEVGSKIKKMIVVQNMVRFIKISLNQSVRGSSRARAEKLNETKPVFLPKVKLSPLLADLKKHKKHKSTKKQEHHPVQPLSSSEFREILSKRREILTSA